MLITSSHAQGPGGSDFFIARLRSVNLQSSMVGAIGLNYF
jgi:hypothetical protein